MITSDNKLLSTGSQRPYRCCLIAKKDWKYRRRAYLDIPKCYPTKMPLSVAWSGPHFMHDSVGPHESTSQSEFQLIRPVLQDLRWWPTEPHTDHDTCVLCNNRPYLMPNVHMLPKIHILINILRITSWSLKSVTAKYLGGLRRLWISIDAIGRKLREKPGMLGRRRSIHRDRLMLPRL